MYAQIGSTSRLEALGERTVLAASRFGHDEDFDALAEGDRSFYGALRWWEAVCAVGPAWLGGGGGAVCKEEAYLHVTRVYKKREKEDRSDSEDRVQGFVIMG
jgi:hypothetical protein